MTPAKKIFVALGTVCAVLVVIAIVSGIYSTFGSRRKYRNYANLVCTNAANHPPYEDERALTTEERDSFIPACTNNILEAIEPCIKEYEFGTDSGIQCFSRYGEPLLQEAAGLLAKMKASPLPSVAESPAKTQARSPEPQQEPSGSTPGVKSSSASAREDTPSPLAAMKELVRTAAERVVQILSVVPINYAACGRAANDAAQAADKAIRQLKALPEGQVDQSQRESLTRAFDTFARAMHLVSNGAAGQDEGTIRNATAMVLQAAKEMTQAEGGVPTEVARANRPLPNEPGDAVLPTGPDLSPFVPNLPQGWKGLRFGMSERDVRNVVNKKWPSGNKRGLREWSVDGDTRIPALTEDGIFDMAPREFCFANCPLRHLKVEDLDDAFNQLSLWFLRGRLIAIMAKPREGVMEPDVIQKAADAYSGHRERSVRCIVNGSGRSEATLVVVC